MQEAESFYADVLHVKDRGLVKELAEITTSVYLDKGEMLVHEGEEQNYFSFLTDGILRGFYIDANGRDVTDCFGYRCGTPAMACIKEGAPALFSIEALTACSFLQIDINALMALLHEEPQLLWIYNDLLKAALEEHWMTKTMLCQHSAMERYQWFLKAYPGLIDQVSNKYIASFLGMTSVTLSRLRRKMRENGGGTAGDQSSSLQDGV